MSRDVIPDRTDHHRTDRVVSTSPESDATVTAEHRAPSTLRAVPTGPAMPGPSMPGSAAPGSDGYAPNTYVAGIPADTAPHVVRRTTVRRAIEVDTVIAGIAGIVVLVVGLLALVRAGTDGPWDDPVVEVAGLTHTATLGLIEIGTGIALLLAAVSRSRSAIAFWGVVLGIAGFVGAVQAESFRDSLALEASLGWWALAVGAIVAVAALFVPRRTHTASLIDTE